MFRAAGAKMDLLESPAALTPVSEIDLARKPSVPTPLKAVAKLLQRVAPWYVNKSLVNATSNVW